jgi:hypothetical protein
LYNKGALIVIGASAIDGRQDLGIAEPLARVQSEVLLNPQLRLTASAKTLTVANNIAAYACLLGLLHKFPRR